MSPSRTTLSRVAAGIAGFSLVLTGSASAFAADPVDPEVGHYVNIPQNELVALKATSEELVGEQASNSGPIGKVLDGDYSTFWHSQWKPSIAAGPHSFVIATKADEPLEGVASITLGTRRSSSGSGRAKDVDIYASADRAKCDIDSDGWELLESRSVPAEDLGDQSFYFDKRAIACVKVTYRSGWDGSKRETQAVSLAEFNMARLVDGPAPLPDEPAPTPALDRPLPEGTVSSSEILDPLALDERVADNPDKSPIALKVPGWNGKDRVVGARKSPVRVVADDRADGQKGTDYFVECGAQGENLGTREAPFTNLDSVNAHGAYQPGDRILFKRGSVCVGLLRPLGSGEADAHIEINAYGNIEDPAPIIHGNGQTVAATDEDVPLKLKSQTGKGIESAVVRLYNQEYWTIRNLELTNYTGDSRDYSQRRRGVVVALEDYGRGAGYTIENLYIHDVLGLKEKDLGGSGGIQFESYAGAEVIPTSFQDIEVAYNRIRHVNRSGINEGSAFRVRPSVGGSIKDNPFEVWGAMDVHDNIVSDIGGDAIVTQFASKSKVYNNTVWDASNHHGGKSPSGNNAAVWPWDADHVHYYQNHVFDTKMPNGTWDGTAFDADYGTTGTLFEYNITHDNMGGFMLFCGCGGLSTDTIMRYNMSINDGRGGENHAEGSRLLFLAGQADGGVYNNTFVLYPNVQISKGASANTAMTLANNVLLAQGSVRNDWNTNLTTTNPYRANLYAGVDSGWPQPEQNFVNADVKLPAGAGLERVMPANELIARQGLPTGPAGMVDITNRPVPDHLNPDLGAFQVSEPANPPAIANGGFEQKDKSWKLADGAQIAKDARGGNYSLVLKGGNATQTFPVGINRTYRLVGAVKADPEGNLPVVAISNPGGHSATATLKPGQDGEWKVTSALMRTAFDATELTVTVSGKGQVDDLALVIEEDYMVDGSFQSFQNTTWQSTGRESGGVSGDRAGAVGGSLSASLENRETVVPEVGVEYELTGWLKSAGSPINMGAKSYGDGSNQTHIDSSESKYVQKSFTLTPKQNRFTTYCYSPSGGAGSCDDFMLTKVWDGQVDEIPAVEEPPGPSDEGVLFRIAGKDRYLTAAKISELYPEGVNTVYVATGGDYPDALAAAAVAGNQDAPVLLVQTTKLPAEVKTALQRLDAKRLVIVGGTGAVSSKVEVDLGKLAGEVVRVKGGDRYATAAALADANFAKGADVVYLASGEDFPDALSASAAAAYQGGPVLLTQQGKLPSSTESALQKLSPKRVIVVGGEGAVSASVSRAAKHATDASVVRYGGSDRYATAQTVVQRVFGNTGVPLAVVASGAEFPDALVGAALAGAHDGPVVLTQPNKLPVPTKNALAYVKPTNVIVTGGSGAVSYGVETAIAKALDIKVSYVPPKL